MTSGILKTTLMLGLATGLVAGAGAAIVPGMQGVDVVVAAEAKKKKHPGKRLYRRMTCMACHGKDGKRAIQDYPNLAGQPKKYLIQQTKDIISGKRKGGLNAQGKPRAEAMRGALVTPEGQVRINDEQIEQIADWLASLDPAPPRPPAELKKEDIEAGKKLYKKKRCRTCHGPDGKKPLKGYPYIAGQKYQYIINQMKDVRDKKRTNGKIKTMYNFVRKLKDDEIAKIAAFLSTVDRTK
jgi:cytochrome c553